MGLARVPRPRLLRSVALAGALVFLQEDALFHFIHLLEAGRDAQRAPLAAHVGGRVRRRGLPFLHTKWGD